jgi:hypothetical protein
MMAQSDVFAALLDKAVRRIHAESGRPINAIEDDLGNLLNRSGRFYIQHLRKGNLPGNRADAEKLVRELVARGVLNREDCIRLLRSADIGDAVVIATQLYSPPATNETFVGKATPEALISISKPVSPTQIVGRAREMRQIFNWWNKSPMQDGIITGPRRSGKTSLLRYLEQSLKHGHALLPGGASYRVISIDFSLSRLCQIQPLLKHLLHGLGLDEPEVPDSCDLETFMDIVTSCNCWQVPTVFLIDEVDLGLKSPELTTAFWNNLRYLVNNVTEGNLAFLLACKDNPADVAKHEGKTSHFFNILKTVPLRALTEAEARMLIATTHVPMSQGDVAWTLTHSQCWPVTVLTVCQERLMALEADETGEGWCEAALAQLASYRHLLEA